MACTVYRKGRFQFSGTYEECELWVENNARGNLSHYEIRCTDPVEPPPLPPGPVEPEPIDPPPAPPPLPPLPEE